MATWRPWILFHQHGDHLNVLIQTIQQIMVLDKNDSGADFLLDGQKIEVVKQFEYLGSLINNKCDSMTEIKHRLAIARKTSQSMENIWKSKGISMNLKLRFLRACVFSIATYGSES